MNYLQKHDLQPSNIEKLLSILANAEMQIR